MNGFRHLVACGLLASCLGCDSGPKSAHGFSLPTGDVAQGKAAFVALKCTSCHRVADSDLNIPEEEQEMTISLGGEVARIKTYGELVTSIINPTHKLSRGYPLDEVQRDGESKMRNYNDVMTVDQLIHLVAFLQSRYKLLEYDPTTYPKYF